MSTPTAMLLSATSERSWRFFDHTWFNFLPYELRLMIFRFLMHGTKCVAYWSLSYYFARHWRYYCQYCLRSPQAQWGGAIQHGKRVLLRPYTCICEIPVAQGALDRLYEQTVAPNSPHFCLINK
jgi:hypothetical protein